HRLASHEQRDALKEYGVYVGERLLSMSNAKRAIRQLRDGEIESATIEDEIDQFQEHWMCDHESGTISRLHKFDTSHDWLVCFDEAHKYARKLVTVGNIVEWFERNKTHRRFGLTATPRRSDGTSIKSLFPKVSVDMSLARGIKDGWSVPMDQKFVRIEEINFAEIKKLAGSSQSKWDAEIAAELEKNLAKFCIPLLEMSDNKRTLAFFPSVKLVQEAVAFVNARKPGSAVGVWGELNPHDRQKIYKEHKSGLVQYLFACGLCRESYNDQAIMCVAIFRPVRKTAVSLAEQMKGRGCRVLPHVIDGLQTADERVSAIAASAKPSVLIIDLVGASGLSDCATTIQIYAEGEPDEVIARAEEILLTGGMPPEECIEQAKRDIAAEKEERERQRLAEIEEREAEARRRAEAKVEVVYSVHDRGVSKEKTQRSGNLASDKQRKYLWVLGFKDINDYPNLSLRQASRIIGQLKSGQTMRDVQRTNRLSTAHKTSTKPLVDEPHGADIPDYDEMFSLFR
ncbi:MAG: hypothetical protein E4H01_03720, partial [Lysobacterales bacterium]